MRYSVTNPRSGCYYFNHNIEMRPKLSSSTTTYSLVWTEIQLGNHQKYVLSLAFYYLITDAFRLPKSLPLVAGLAVPIRNTYEVFSSTYRSMGLSDHSIAMSPFEDRMNFTRIIRNARSPRVLFGEDTMNARVWGTHIYRVQQWRTYCNMSAQRRSQKKS